MANSGKLVSIWNESSLTWKTFGVDWNNIAENNEIVRTPTEYNGISSTVVDSARNVKGVVVGQVVKEDIAKIEVSWNFLTVKEFADLSKLFLEKYGGSFFVPVAFFNEAIGDFEGDNQNPPSLSNNVRIFYPADRSAKFAQIKLDASGKPIGYVNVSLHLVDTGKRYVE